MEDQQDLETDFQNFIENKKIDLIRYEDLKFLPNPLETKYHKIYKGILGEKQVVIKHLFTSRNAYHASYYRMLKLSLESKILFEYNLYEKFYGVCKDAKNNNKYLVFEDVEGKNLQEIMTGLNKDKKLEILINFFKRIR
jgi:hypothetical protein